VELLVSSGAKVWKIKMAGEVEFAVFPGGRIREGKRERIWGGSEILS